MITITTNESNPATLKILIALKIANRTNYSINILQPSGTSKSFPKLLPEVRFDDDKPGGVKFFSSNAVLRYLLPSSSSGAKTTQWLEYEALHVSPTVSLAISGKSDHHKAALTTILKTLNTLSINTLQNNQLSPHEIALWCTLFPLWSNSSFKNEFFITLTNLDAWMAKLSKTPIVQQSLNEYQMKSAEISYQSLLQAARYPLKLPTDMKNEQNSTISPEELASCRLSWETGRQRLAKPKLEVSTVLPIAGEENILITSALPYVNNVPHLGNIIGCVLSADVFARFARLCNWNVLYIGGTDEYGTATETKALQEGLTPREVCDKYFEIHNAIYRWFNIGFDFFGRTTTPEQTSIVQEMFLDLKANCFMQTQQVEQLLCQHCDRYLADRFVEGGCPHPLCGYEDARGDQCDGCGKLVNAIELKNPRCKICASTPVIKTSEQFFLSLDQLEPLLLRWLKDSMDGWTSNARVITKSWMREGLKARCITRDLKWGIPVPIDGFREKVFYVWFDAPLGYISITQRYTKDWRKWWQPEKDTKISLYQFMGKDNVPFHAVMFPGCLLGVDKGYTLVKHIMATEYVNYEDGKFSKSRGVGVFGTDAQETGISSDVWRFYLLYIRPESQDSNFSWNDLALKNNTELLNNLGNFANRALMFTEKYFESKVPLMELNDDDLHVLAMCTRELKAYCSALKTCKLRDGIRHILAISKHGNQHMQSTQPWLLVKGTAQDVERAGTVVGICVNLTCLLATLLFPYMPDASRTLRKQLNAPGDVFVLAAEQPEIVTLLPTGHIIGKPAPLFHKLDSEFIDALRKQFGGSQEVTQTIPSDVHSLQAQIDAQAQKVRTLKESGAGKADWQPEVNILLELKKKLAEATGQPLQKGKSKATKK